MGCAHMSTKHPRQLAVAVHTVINALPGKHHPTGAGPSLAWRNRLIRLLSKLRWKPKQQRKSTANDHKSPSSRTPGSRSVVGSGNFDAEGKTRHLWKLLGPASATTLSAGSAYGERSPPTPLR